jgi:hypothetical protein
MGPVLTFNTYNKCYGRFSDPDDIDLTPGTYDDESGKGFQGDYEFVMVDVPENGDHVMLKGKKRGVYQRLSRLPEGTDFESYLDDIATFNANHFVKNAPWELTMVEGGKKYRMNWMFRGYASVYPEGSDSTTYGWHEPFLVTKYNDEYHLRFKDTLMVEGHQMEQEFAYSAADDKFYGVIDKSNTIEGYPPYAFFTETVSDMHVWNLSKSGEMSEKLKTLIDAIDNDFSSLKDNKNRSYAFIGINFGRNVQTTDGVRDTVDCWSVVYRSPGSSRNTSANFIFNASFSGDDSMSLQYKEPINVASQNVANKFNNIYDLWSLLSRKFVISAAETRFNLTHIKLVASDDPDLWMILNY